MPDASEKICVLCGESCAGQPRIKDSRGRYYHKHCHERAVRQQRQRERRHERSATEAFVAAEPPPVLGGDDDVMSMLLDDSLPAVPPTMAGASTCPSCGEALAAGAVLCVHCGFNVQSGGALHTSVKKERSLPSGRAASMLMTPLAIGLGALAVFGLLFFGATQSETGAMLFVGAYGVYGLIVGIWAIIAGFMDGILAGILTLCLPFYVLYTVYGLNENGYLKWLYGTYLLAAPGYIYVILQYGDVFQQGGFGV